MSNSQWRLGLQNCNQNLTAGRVCGYDVSLTGHSLLPPKTLTSNCPSFSVSLTPDSKVWRKDSTWLAESDHVALLLLLGRGAVREELLLRLLLLLNRFSPVWLCATPQTAAHQATPSLGFSRQEHWSGLPFPSSMHETGKWKWKWSRVQRGIQSVQFSSVAQSCPTLCDPITTAHQASLSITNSWSLLKPMST